MNYSENNLIQRCKDGDIDAFEELIKAHKQRVYNIALKMLNNTEDAMDVSQEAFIKIYRSIGSFNMQSSFSTWLYKVVVNTCLDFIKKNKKLEKAYSIDEFTESREVNFSQQLIKNKYDTPEEALDRKIKRQTIIRAINELPENFKTVIILRDIQGFSYDEIANITNCSLGTVKSRIKRARESFKKLVENTI